MSWAILSKISTVKVYHHLESICKVNDPSNEIFLILKGKVAALGGKRRNSIKITDVRNLLFGLMGSGSAFGEIGVFENTIRYLLFIKLIGALRALRLVNWRQYVS